MKKPWKQTFLVEIYDTQDKYLDFQRFACKRLDTVVKQMRELCKSSMYRAVTKDISYALVYETDYDKKSPPVAAIQF